MNSFSVAPCGVICDLCLGFQRTKNHCDGCNSDGEKTKHCTVCTIRFCAEKRGNPEQLCITCSKFPCRRIRDLDKRYRTRYGESPMQNMQRIQAVGMRQFLQEQQKIWQCPNCGELFCVHRENCMHCGTPREYLDYKLDKKQ